MRSLRALNRVIKFAFPFRPPVLVSRQNRLDRVYTAETFLYLDTHIYTKLHFTIRLFYLMITLNEAKYNIR